VEALRLVSIIVNRLGHLRVADVPRWLDIPIVNKGVVPSLDHQDFDFSNVFHRYGDPPAKITASFDTGLTIIVYIGGEERVHAVLKDPTTRTVISQSQARRRLGDSSVGILPQISPVAPTETILVPEYVRRALSSNLASLHFRNQINLLYDEAFAPFKRISEETWPGLRYSNW
jgi:hypothetical protein